MGIGGKGGPVCVYAFTSQITCTGIVNDNPLHITNGRVAERGSGKKGCESTSFFFLPKNHINFRAFYSYVSLVSLATLSISSPFSFCLAPAGKGNEVDKA